jgi:hypothetical protein
MTMTAQTFNDLNGVARKLSATLSSARFGRDRGGMIPPDAIYAMTEEVRDALATMDALWATESAAAYSSTLRLGS